MRVLLVASLVLSQLGCSPSFSKEDGESLVRRIGEKRIRNAVELMRHQTKPQSRVPASAWPDAVREFQPKWVDIDSEGVWIMKSSFYLQGEGVFVCFSGRPEPKEHWGDPSIWRIAERIYWYQFTG